jgi:Holliday junction resolvase-like predicted endonuclease
MATGRQTKLAGQTGEYIVAAELSRRGLIATTFTGNVPHYDIIASDEKGKHVSVQVKSARVGSWQFGDISQFVKITFRGKRQVVGRAKRSPVRGLICVMVRLGKYGEDKFYVLPWVKLRDMLVKNHKRFLGRVKGVRPRRWDSLHCAIAEKSFALFENRWDYIEKGLR